MMYDKLSPYFNFNGCSFIIHKTKESTGLVVMWKEFSLTNAYTCEVGFCGPSQGKFKGYHFTMKMLKEMGFDFCKTLAIYSESDISYYNQILQEV